MNTRDSNMHTHEPPPAGLQALPRVMHPARDLWPEIDARLQPRAARPRRGGIWRRPALALAASLMLVVIAGLLLSDRNPGPGSQPLVADSSMPAASFASGEPALVAALMVTEREYQAAFSAMAPLPGHLASAQAGPGGELQRSWDKMQQAETGLLAALNEYPDNPFLAQKLVALRTQQLAFMRQVYQLDQDYRRRT